MEYTPKQIKYIDNEKTSTPRAYKIQYRQAKD
jgi:hypothetical protein